MGCAAREEHLGVWLEGFGMKFFKYAADNSTMHASRAVEVNRHGCYIQEQQPRANPRFALVVRKV